MDVWDRYAAAFQNAQDQAGSLRAAKLRKEEAQDRLNKAKANQESANLQDKLAGVAVATINGIGGSAAVVVTVLIGTATIAVPWVALPVCAVAGKCTQQ